MYWEKKKRCVNQWLYLWTCQVWTSREFSGLRLLSTMAMTEPAQVCCESPLSRQLLGCAAYLHSPWLLFKNGKNDKMYPSFDVGGNGESAHPVRSCLAKNTLKVFCALAWPEYEINCFIWKENAVSSVGSEFEETGCPMLNCVSKELYLELLFGHARQRGDRRFMILLTKRKERPLVSCEERWYL